MPSEYPVIAKSYPTTTTESSPNIEGKKPPGVRSGLRYSTTAVPGHGIMRPAACCTHDMILAAAAAAAVGRAYHYHMNGNPSTV